MELLNVSDDESETSLNRKHKVGEPLIHPETRRQRGAKRAGYWVKG